VAVVVKEEEGAGGVEVAVVEEAVIPTLVAYQQRGAIPGKIPSR